MTSHGPGAAGAGHLLPARELPGRGRMLARALALRCPLCGARGLFRRWVHLAEACPGCAHHFEREEGYWVGAMIMSTGATQVAFFGWFLGGMALTWPDVPWSLLLYAGVGLMLAFPLAFYPWSKTLWLWLDFLLHPLAATRAASHDRAPG